MSRTVTEALLDKIDQQDKEIERLRSVLQSIVERDGNTLLGCSPEHDYVPDLHPEEERAHQYGAYKAFSQCARIAAAALEDDDE